LKFNLPNKITLLATSFLFLAFFAIYSFLKEHLPQNSSNDFLLKEIFLILFITLVVFYIYLRVLLTGFVIKPLERIKSLVKDISQGQFGKIFSTGHDEIGYLSKAINQMSEETNSKIADLTATKSHLEAVFLSMFEGVMVLDKEGNIILMNKALRDFMGVTHDFNRRKPLEIIRNIEIQNLADKVLTLKSGVETAELSVLLPEEKNLLIHATPVIREDQTQGAVLVFHDITQIKYLETIRKDFVANVSHELRTPVSTIKGYAETLLEGALEDKENARDFVQIIYTDADRLAKLINELLDLSQIESGNIKLNFVACPLRPIVDRVLKLLSKKINEQGIEVKAIIPNNLPRMKADETSLVQILLNLIENAIKYNKPQGTITIFAKENGPFIEISISDTGIGIPEEDLPRVFERFYRVDKAHSRQLGGSGLGLSIVKHMVLAHQGEVSAESVLDEGSTFRFTIPTLS
jgi:two-component system phosphate regulon sensor histidine kinase PhoR